MIRYLFSYISPQSRRPVALTFSLEETSGSKGGVYSAVFLSQHSTNGKQAIEHVYLIQVLVTLTKHFFVFNKMKSPAFSDCSL